MEQESMKQAFMECAVRVVARDGMEKATTKAIAAEAKLNEAYIYKCFSNKDELLSAALHMEDVRLANLLQKNASCYAYAGFAVEGAGVYPLEKKLGFYSAKA